jgi:predicted dithiol-disulfide oxidoreductase (DUF899 family)
MPSVATRTDREAARLDLLACEKARARRHGPLVVQHCMDGADRDEGCPSCSFLVDDVLASIAPLDQLPAYRDRMG